MLLPEMFWQCYVGSTVEVTVFHVTEVFVVVVRIHVPPQIGLRFTPETRTTSPVFSLAFKVCVFCHYRNYPCIRCTFFAPQNYLKSGGASKTVVFFTKKCPDLVCRWVHFVHARKEGTLSHWICISFFCFAWKSHFLTQNHSCCTGRSSPRNVCTWCAFSPLKDSGTSCHKTDICSDSLNGKKGQKDQQNLTLNNWHCSCDASFASSDSTKNFARQKGLTKIRVRCKIFLVQWFGAYHGFSCDLGADVHWGSSCCSGNTGNQILEKNGQNRGTLKRLSQRKRRISRPAKIMSESRSRKRSTVQPGPKTKRLYQRPRRAASSAGCRGLYMLTTTTMTTAGWLTQAAPLSAARPKNYQIVPAICCLLMWSTNLVKLEKSPPHVGQATIFSCVWLRKCSRSL